MFDADNGDRPGRSGSLLSLSRAMRAPAKVAAEPAPVEAEPMSREDRVEEIARSLARARSEAAARRDKLEQFPEEESAEPSWRERLFGRGEERETGEPEPIDPEAAEPAQAPVRAEPAIAVAPAAVVVRDGVWRPLIDPVQVVTGVWNSKAIIVAATILGGLIGVAVALSTPKQYEAVTELVFDPRNLNIVEREITQEGLPSDATLALVENQVRVMTSGNVLTKVVDQLDLVDDPEFNGEGEGGIRSWLPDIRSLFRAESTADEAAMKRAIAAGNLYEALDVERRGKTFVIGVAATTRDGEKSALIANTLVEVFIKTYGELQSGRAERATVELTARLDELRAEVEEAERDVETFKAEHDIVDPQGRLITDDEIVRLNEQLTVARARTIELNARAASARAIDVDAAIGGTLPEGITSSVITELRAQYASLRQEADRLTVRLGPRHPRRLDMEAQLAGAREQLQGELRRLVSSIQVELRRAVQLEQDLAARLAQLKARHAGVGGELVTLREMERRATAARAVYEAFLLRARETGQQQSLNTANVSVISIAHPPLLPNGPSRSMITLLGMMLGFMAGVAIGGVRGAVASVRSSGILPPSGPQPNRGRPDARREEAEPDQLQRGPTREQAFSPQPVASAATRAADHEDAGDFDRLFAEEDDWRDDRDEEELQMTIEEIRASLLEVRDAVRGLAEERARRYA